MRRFMGKLLVCLLLWHLSNVASVLAYKKVKCFVLTPPKQMLVGVKRIAILDFSSEGTRETDKKTDFGERIATRVLESITKEKLTDEPAATINYGRNFTNYLISNLIEPQRGVRQIQTGFLGLGSGREGKSLQAGTFTNVYDVVERNQLERVIQEQQLGATGLINDAQAVQLGNLLGVQAMVTGDISYFSKDTDYKETRTQKKDGQKVSKEVKCQKRQVKVTVRARIISMENGQILGSTEFPWKEEKSKCEDSFGSLPNTDEMIDNALKTLSSQVANYFSPVYQLEDYELEKVKVDQFKKPAERAAELAEEYKIDEAYAIYKTIYDADNYNPEALYNIGVMHEVVGNYVKAKEFYDQASQLKEDDKYKEAFKRIEKSVEFAGALTKIGIEIKEHTFDVSETAQARALAKKAEIKGERKDRVNVYAQADKGSEVVAQVPGSLTFVILSEDGDWYRIQLLGGKEGYVHKENVKVKE